MTRIAHILRELGRNIYRNPGTAVASILSLTLLFLLFDLFWIAAGTSDRFYQDLLSDLRVEVFLEESVADSNIVPITGELSAIEGVLEATYISRDKARERLTSLVGTDLLVGYDESNPLPRSFVLRIDTDYLNSEKLDAIESELRSIGVASEISYSRRWLTKAEGARSLILEIGLILGALILATALVSSANNIRLMTKARATGFRQMLLLGAGRLFISFPFAAEGFLISGLSAAFGWLIIMYGRERIQFSQFDIVYPTLEEIVVFCGIAAVLGATSGFFGVSRQLKD